MSDFIIPTSLQVYDPQITNPENNEDVLALYVIESDENGYRVYPFACRFIDGDYYSYDDYLEPPPDLWVKLPDKETLRNLWIRKEQLNV